MPLSVNQIKFFDEQTINDLLEKTSGPGLFRGTQGEIFFIYAEGNDATYAIDIKILGQWRQVAEGTAKEGRLVAVDVSFFMPEARVRFKPVVAPAKVSCEAYGYPAVYIREAADPDHELGRTREDV